MSILCVYMHTFVLDCCKKRLFKYVCIQHSMGSENNVGLGGCWIMEYLLPYSCMVTVPHIMVGLERMLDYRGVGLERFHCISIYVCTYMPYHSVSSM